MFVRPSKFFEKWWIIFLILRNKNSVSGFFFYLNCHCCSIPFTAPVFLVSIQKETYSFNYLLVAPMVSKDKSGLWRMEKNLNLLRCFKDWDLSLKLCWEVIEENGYTSFFLPCFGVYSCMLKWSDFFFRSSFSLRFSRIVLLLKQLPTGYKTVSTMNGLLL